MPKTARTKAVGDVPTITLHTQGHLHPTVTQHGHFTRSISLIYHIKNMTSIQLTPEEAVADFLKEKEGEVSASSHRNYRYPLRYFTEFCNARGIDYVNDLTGYHLKQFKVSRRNDDINNVTLRNNLSTLRVFLQWCEEAQLVEPNFHELVQLPKMDDGELVSDQVFQLEEVEAILDYLKTFEFATRRHATFQLMWHTCIRMGTVQALDLDDYLPDQQVLKIRHRPETGTPLKNGAAAERKIALNDSMSHDLDMYVNVMREDVTDEYGREPLFTTPTKRLYDTILRKDVYAITRPCFIGLDCPHDRNPDDCEATRKAHASKCPSSLSPHPLRRAAITYHLNRDWPKEKLSERANVSVSILEEHYDARTEDEKVAARKRFLDNM